MPLFLEDREKFESEHRQNIERLIIHVYDLWEIWRFSELYAKRILQPLIIHTNYLMVNRTNCMKSVAKYLDIDELITLEIAEKTCHNPESLDIICSLRSVQTLLVPKTVTLPKCLSQKSDSLFRVVQT